MNARDLFIIVLRITGIYFIKEILVAIPPVLYDFSQFYEISHGVAIYSLVFSFLRMGFFLLIVYFLLFKTDIIVTKLKLTAGLGEEPFKLNMHRSSVYTIAIIVTGLLILVFAIPSLVRQLYYWVNFMDARKVEFRVHSFDYSALLAAFAEVAIGFLLLGNQRSLVNFIESRSRKSGITTAEKERNMNSGMGV